MSGPHIIKYFMWSWQHLFISNCESAATAVFNLLDAELDPKVILLGFLEESRDDRHPICIEPEESGIDVAAFGSTSERAAELAAEDPDRRMIHTHPVGEAANRARIRQRAWGRAITEALGVLPSQRDRSIHVSVGVRVDAYRVYVILTFDERVGSRYPALKIATRDRMEVPKSLIDSVVSNLLDDCAHALTSDDPGANRDVLDRDAEEIIRRAGKQLMATPAMAVGSIEGVHGLFRSMNAIAWLRYEGEPAVGWVDIVAKDASHVGRALSFASPVALNNYRHVRKLLSMTSEDSHLLCDGKSIFATGRIGKTYDPVLESAFEVRFVGDGVWELRHDGMRMMVVRNGVPGLSRALLSVAEFVEIMERVVGAAPATSRVLWPLIECLIDQGHGSMLIVSAGAESEAKRLGAQGTLVVPTPATVSILRAASRIDGATLLDPTGRVHAIGVILDGMATTKGDMSRGARFNSAVRYLGTAGARGVILVVSDDGMVDLLPKLRPRICRAWVSDAVRSLEEVAASGIPSRKKFHETMDVLEALEFYLPGSTCVRVNELRRAIELGLEQEDASAFRLIREDLAPSAEMDETYFLD